MLQLTEFQKIIGDALFGGSADIAGLAIFAAVLGIVFALCKKSVTTGILLMLPLTLVFSMMGVLSNELTMLLIVVTVLILAMMAKKTFGD